MVKDEFINEIKKLGIELTNFQLEQLTKYYELLIFYNKQVNLTRITEEKDVYLKHFYDSLTLIKVVDLTKSLTLCDIGTGAGFPGIVLKICFPNLNITLVDSLQKRIKFLDLVIESLSLTNIKAVHARIEDYKSSEKFDVVVSRAVANTKVLVELACQLPKVGGLLLLMKANLNDELLQAKDTISNLNYKIEDIINFKLPIEQSERNIIVLKKIKPTSNKYPRKFKEIKNG